MSSAHTGTGQTAGYQFKHPRGVIHGWFSSEGLYSLELPTAEKEHAPHVKVLHSSINDGRVRNLHAALERYFSGQPESFENIPLDFGTCTAFRFRVWTALREISWGHTATYGELSERLGYGTRASRAVGQALHHNPLPIVVPCHRILAHNGLGGFGAGLDWKRELLCLEGVDV